ncbi:MAG: hypothetical protein D6782_03055, partial [Alphaproteobacteria bacterium]
MTGQKALPFLLMLLAGLGAGMTTGADMPPFQPAQGVPATDNSEPLLIALAQDRSERIRHRMDSIERRQQAIERLRHLQRIEAMRRAERAALRRWIEYRVGRTIAERRRAAIRTLIRDRHGHWMLRNHILSIAPDDAALARLRARGFSLVRWRRFDALDLDIAVIGIPAGLDPEEALALAKETVPEGRFEANHLFDPLGAGAQSDFLAPLDGPLPWDGLPAADGLKVGQIDLGVDSGHPALKDARIAAQVFTSENAPAPSAHGTAVASLLVGRLGAFSGASAGAQLYAADVFGDADDGGSVEAIVGALEWMVATQVPVVAMPLAGPPNALLAIALDRAAARGIVVVAPVGNDGPTKPVAWPAAHPSVIAVTATDRDGHVFLTAQRGPQ